LAERFVLSDPLNAIYFGAARWRFETRDEDKKTRRGFSLGDAGSDTGIHCTVLITPRLSVKTPLTPDTPKKLEKSRNGIFLFFVFGYGERKKEEYTCGNACDAFDDKWEADAVTAENG